MSTNITISDPQKIKDLAHVLVRQANNDHPMLEQSFDEFVKAGINNPSYSKTILKGAQMDNVTQMAEDVINGYLSFDEYKYKAQHGGFVIDDLFTKTESGNKFNEAFIKQHPKTWMQRSAVLKGLSEGLSCKTGIGDFVECAKNKNIKTVVYKALKRACKYFKNNPDKIKTLI